MGRTTTRRALSLALALFLPLLAAANPTFFAQNADATWTPFVPTDIAGCTFWVKDGKTGTYDADTGGSASSADGVVKRWEDQSGNAHHATQTTTGNAPIRKVAAVNGLDTVRFDGTNDVLATAGFTQALNGSMFIVMVKRGTLASFARFVEIGTNNSLTLCQNSSTSASYFQFGSNLNASAGSTLTNGNTYVLGLVNATGAGLARGYQNGVLIINGTGTNGSNTSLSVTLGGNASLYLNGDLCEVIIYDTALSVANTAKVNGYLMTRWGVTRAQASWVPPRPARSFATSFAASSSSSFSPFAFRLRSHAGL